SSPRGGEPPATGRAAERPWGSTPAAPRGATARARRGRRRSSRSAPSGEPPPRKSRIPKDSRRTLTAERPMIHSKSSPGGTASARRFGFAMIKEEGHVVADRLGADRTPEAFLVDAQGTLRYRGWVKSKQDSPDLKR